MTNYRIKILKTAQKKSKIVLITGSSSGIGQAAAYRFAQEGYTVIVTYHQNRTGGMQTVEKCREMGAQAKLFKLDVMDDNNIKDVVNEIVRLYGKIDILVNNAGIYVEKPFPEQDFDDIEMQIRTNLEGLIKMTRECMEHITGAIVNISSVNGHEGNAGTTSYSASKWGVRGFTKALATDLHEKKSPIKVYSVNPDAVKTKMSGWTGRPASEVGDLIYEVVTGNKWKSGNDIIVPEAIDGKKFKPQYTYPNKDHKLK